MRYASDRDRIIRNAVVDPETGCWEWQKSGNLKGYGQIRVNDVLTLAHRLSYSLFVRPIPDGLCVLHHCDNPGCVNPDHLFTGTKAENNADMRSKGRMAVGSKCCFAKITDKEYNEIRGMLRAGVSQYTIAERYGVTQSNICKINTGKSWKHKRDGDQK